MARYPPSLESPALFLSDPLSSCSSRSSSSRSSRSSSSRNSRSSSSRSTTAAPGAIYSSNSSTHLPSAISLAAASRVQTEIYHAPKWALFSRLVCHVGREYKAPYLSRRRTGCRQGCIMRRNMPRPLAWYAVSAVHIMNITIIISNDPRTLYFRPERNCEQIRDVWVASSGTVVAACNCMSLLNARRGPGLLDFEGSGLPISVAT